MKKFLLTFAMLIVAVSSALAQVTTSALSGKVSLQSNGESLIGAVVQAVHEPSGTRYATATNIDGRYTIQGMRVGGPYKVTVSYIGYTKKNVTGITLQLGETYNLNVNMSEDQNELGEVVVSAKGSKFAGEKTGATTNISQTQMQNIPTINRSISDIARLSPYANGMSFAGGDGRSTNFTLDGANLNNNFGLTSKLPGGGNPISMDAIDEVQVVVSPYDVRQTNFIGGGINAVTKSGTNTFKGSAYIYYNNENMHGNRVDDADLGERGKNRTTTYGFTLGGPIVKDKLFFFANAEYTKVPGVANRWAPSENGKADIDKYISRTKKSDLDRVAQFLKEKYGYNPGSYTNWGADEHNLKLLGRIDWNITNDHHLAVRFNHTANKMWNAPNGNSSDTGYRLRNMDRLSQYSMSFSNSMYSMENNVTSVTADLNSRFGDKFANQLLFTPLGDGQVTMTYQEGTTTRYMLVGDTERGPEIFEKKGHKDSSRAWLIYPSTAVPSDIHTASGTQVSIQAVGRRIVVSGTSNYDVYDIQGRRVDSEAELLPGVYVVEAAGTVKNVLVK